MEADENDFNTSKALVKKGISPNNELSFQQEQLRSYERKAEFLKEKLDADPYNSELLGQQKTLKQEIEELQANICVIQLMRAPGEVLGVEGQERDKPLQEGFKILDTYIPEEIFTHIFSFLSLETLSGIRSVSNDFRRIADDEISHREINSLDLTWEAKQLCW